MESAGAVGIDMGASHYCVGVCRDNQVEIITNEEGNKITPAYVGFRDLPTKRNESFRETVIGEAAKDQVKILGIVFNVLITFFLRSFLRREVLARSVI